MPPKPPPKKITSLSQIDISKLDVNDLQHIDFEKLIKDIRKKPDTAISFAVPLITIFLCFNMFTKFQAEQRKLSNTIIEMKSKAQVLDEYKNAQADFEKFTNSLPRTITENEFVNTITDLAVKHHVQIESYSPGQNKGNPTHDTMSISLVANTPEFADMGRFIQNIENLGLAIRINSWSGSMAQYSGGASRRGAGTTNPDNMVVNFRLDISAVNIKL